MLLAPDSEGRFRAPDRTGLLRGPAPSRQCGTVTKGSAVTTSPRAGFRVCRSTELGDCSRQSALPDSFLSLPSPPPFLPNWRTTFPVSQHTQVGGCSRYSRAFAPRRAKSNKSQMNLRHRCQSHCHNWLVSNRTPEPVFSLPPSPFSCLSSMSQPNRSEGVSGTRSPREDALSAKLQLSRGIQRAALAAQFRGAPGFWELRHEGLRGFLQTGLKSKAKHLPG